MRAPRRPPPHRPSRSSTWISDHRRPTVSLLWYDTSPGVLFTTAYRVLMLRRRRVRAQSSSNLLDLPAGTQASDKERSFTASEVVGASKSYSLIVMDETGSQSDVRTTSLTGCCLRALSRTVDRITYVAPLPVSEPFRRGPRARASAQEVLRDPRGSADVASTACPFGSPSPGGPADY